MWIVNKRTHDADTVVYSDEDDVAVQEQLRAPVLAAAVHEATSVDEHQHVQEGCPGSGQLSKEGRCDWLVWTSEGPCWRRWDDYDSSFPERSSTGFHLGRVDVEVQAVLLADDCRHRVPIVLNALRGQLRSVPHTLPRLGGLGLLRQKWQFDMETDDVPTTASTPAKWRVGRHAAHSSAVLPTPQALAHSTSTRGCGTVLTLSRQSGHTVPERA